MKTRILARYELMTFGRMILMTWLVFFFLTDGLTFILRLLLHNALADFTVDGTLITPVSMVLMVCLVTQITKFTHLGFAVGVTRKQQWQALALTVLGGSVLAEIGLSLWSFQLRFIGGASEAILRDFGYQGPWNFGAAVSNLLFEWGIFVIVFAGALLIATLIMYVPSNRYGQLLGAMALLMLMVFPLRALINWMAPAGSPAGVLTRRIANGSVIVNHGTAGTPYLAAVICLVVGLGMLLLTRLCMRRMALQR